MPCRAIHSHGTWGWDGQYNSHGKSLILSLKFIYHQGYSYAYPCLIFDADISSFFDKVFHCVVTAIVSCNMYGSPLIGENSKFLSDETIVIWNALTSAFTQVSITYVAQVNDISDGGFEVVAIHSYTYATTKLTAVTLGFESW